MSQTSQNAIIKSFAVTSYMYIQVTKSFCATAKRASQLIRAESYDQTARDYVFTVFNSKTLQAKTQCSC